MKFGQFLYSLALTGLFVAPALAATLPNDNQHSLSKAHNADSPIIYRRSMGGEDEEENEEKSIKKPKSKKKKGKKESEESEESEDSENESDEVEINAVKGSGKGQTVKLTYYWVTNEKDYKLGSEVAIKNCDGGVLARVSREYWDQVHMEGSGKLRDGTYINCGDGGCNCFFKSKPVGSKGDLLEIYSSVAVNDHKVGSNVFISEFANLVLPNGKKHNGCFKIIDKSWSFGGDHIDVYVEDKKNYEKIQSKLSTEKAKAQFNASCKVLKY